ncbi:MAG: site-specific integrase [Alphaproteobacteria bacterium]|nr:MAG: site-specific integrase [Alphaproteobacteria bacterium]
MPRTKLTDRAVAAAKAPPGGRLELWDTGLPGLFLRVSDASKIWGFRYRRLDGSQPRVRLGHYVAPEHAEDDNVSLTVAGARIRARKLRTQVDDGLDPASAKAAAKAEARAQPLRTVDDMAVAYFLACEIGEYRPRKKKKRATTLAGERWLYGKYLKPYLGDVRVEDLSRQAVRKRLRDMVASGVGVTTNRTRALLRQIYAWGIAEGRVHHNPAAEVTAPVEERSRDRVLADDELQTLWAGLQDISGLRQARADGKSEPLTVSRAVRIAIQLCLLTMQRRGEVARMRVRDLDFEKRTWTIPAEMTKAGRQHVVPLTARAVDLIEEAMSLRRSPDAPCVFPSPRNPTISIEPSALTQAIRDIRAAIGIADITVHDLRRTGATLLAERAGVSPFIIGLLLNHAGERGGAAAVTMNVYVRTDFMADKRRAVEALDEALTGAGRLDVHSQDGQLEV